MGLAGGLASIGLAHNGIAASGGGGAASWAPVQVVGFQGNAPSSITVTLKQATVAGNWVCVLLGMQGSGGTTIPTTVTDSASNTYSTSYSRDSNGVGPVLVQSSTTAASPASATTVSITWSATNTFSGLIIEGKGTGAVGYQSSSTAASSSANSLSASVTTTAALEVVIGAMLNNGYSPVTRTAGYVPNTVTTSSPVLDVAYKSVAPGTQTYQAAFYTGFNQSIALGVARFLSSL